MIYVRVEVMAVYNIHSKEGVNWVEVLLSNETVRTEAGAMRYVQGQIVLESKAAGGSLGGMFKAALTGESIVRPTYTGTGKLVLEPTLGSFFELDLAGESFVLDRGAYWVSDGSISVDAKMNKAVTGILSGEGLFQTTVSGAGKVILNTPGPVEVLDLVNDRLVVDGTFAVARSSKLSFRVERSAKSMLGSASSGEGLVNVFEGSGRVYLAPVPNRYLLLQQAMQGIAATKSS